MAIDNNAQEEVTTTRKIVAGLYMSLDGVVDSPEKWGFAATNKEMTDVIVAGIAQADALLLGPHTYLLFAQLWQHQSSDVPMANFLNNSPKYVVSNTMDTLEWQPATLIKGNLVEELTKLKLQPGKNIQIPGSPRLVRSLLRDGLLGELSLNICPVVVGSGMRLFDEINNQVNLKLVDSKIYSNGVLGVTYQPVRSGDQVTEQPLHFPHAAARK
jgi:dihydrofolate reductase